MKDIYFLSGLGADERVFQYLELPGFRIHHVYWLEPEKHESMNHYAERLLAQIPTEKPIIAGMSFGGMLAVEMSKFIKTEKIILLSSTATHHGIPPYFQFLNYTKIHRWMPMSLLKIAGTTAGTFLFGPANKQEYRILKSIIYDTNEKFFRWAWEKVVTWKNETIPDNLYHIHGDSDWMLPLQYVKADSIIHKGTHLMTLSHYKEISALIEKAVND